MDPSLRQTAGCTNKSGRGKATKKAYRSPYSGMFTQFVCTLRALFKDSVNCWDNVALVTDK
jgi:hypothetical protein